MKYRELNSLYSKISHFSPLPTTFTMSRTTTPYLSVQEFIDKSAANIAQFPQGNKLEVPLFVDKFLFIMFKNNKTTFQTVDSDGKWNAVCLRKKTGTHQPVQTLLDELKVLAVKCPTAAIVKKSSISGSNSEYRQLAPLKISIEVGISCKPLIRTTFNSTINQDEFIAQLNKLNSGKTIGEIVQIFGDFRKKNMPDITNEFYLIDQKWFTSDGVKLAYPRLKDIAWESLFEMLDTKTDYKLFVCRVPADVMKKEFGTPDKALIDQLVKTYPSAISISKGKEKKIIKTAGDLGLTVEKDDLVSPLTDDPDENRYYRIRCTYECNVYADTPLGPVLVGCIRLSKSGTTLLKPDDENKKYAIWAGARVLDEY